MEVLAAAVSHVAGGERLGHRHATRTAERRGAGVCLPWVTGNCPFPSGGFCPPKECFGASWTQDGEQGELTAPEASCYG